MLERAERVIVLADNSKFGEVTFVNISDLSKVDTIITNKGENIGLLDQIKKRGRDNLCLGGDEVIITLTLNPAVDKTAKVENLRIGELNRIKDFRRDAGGKGINVSRVVKELGEKTKALGFIAGNNGRYIIDQLKNMGVDHDF